MAGKLELFRPNHYVMGLADIDLAALKSDGFDTLMLDLDNTLLPWRSVDVPDFSREWIECAKGLGMKLCIVSNTHNPKRLSRISKDLDVPSIFKALKPRRYGFDKAMEMLGSDPACTAVIGDQILTDILGGNMAGLRTILVHPMDSYEFIGTKVSRLVEWVILALLRRKTEQGTNPESSQSERHGTK